MIKLEKQGFLTVGKHGKIVHPKRQEEEQKRGEEEEKKGAAEQQSTQEEQPSEQQQKPTEKLDEKQAEKPAEKQAEEKPLPEGNTKEESEKKESADLQSKKAKEDLFAVPKMEQTTAERPIISEQQQQPQQSKLVELHQDTAQAPEGGDASGLRNRRTGETLKSGGQRAE